MVVAGTTAPSAGATGVVAVESEGVGAVALESVDAAAVEAADESGTTEAELLDVGLDEVVLVELELLPICVSRKKPTTTTRRPMTPIWTIGLSLMAFLMRSPGAAAESKRPQLADAARLKNPSQKVGVYRRVHKGPAGNRLPSHVYWFTMRAAIEQVRAFRLTIPVTQLFDGPGQTLRKIGGSWPQH